ncbi:hypothetical protein ACF0H5_017850 [Mactra antiquata]
MEESFKRDQPLRTGIGNKRESCRKLLLKYRSGKYLNTCPYHVIMTVDFDRYPVAMATAECTCKQCYNRNFRQPHGREDKKIVWPTQCVRIPYTYKVLKQQYSNGTKVCDDENKFVYYETYETLYVGCACALINDKTISMNRTVPEP